MKILYTLTAVIVLILASSPASAGLRPSFAPEGCAWRATDIVVVTEDQKIDGVFRILETLKGELQPGETISVPEMEEFKNKDARLVSSYWFGETEKSGPPEYVTGERMILFLRDATKIPADEAENDNGVTKNTARWQSANSFGDEVRYSTVWIEKGKVYWFVQVMNPGPSSLHRAGITEAEFRSVVAHVLSTQTSLNAALTILDLKTRAESLEPFVQDPIYPARVQAFDGLKDCGEAALPVLRRMLNNELLSEYQSNVIDAFAAAGGSSAGPDLTAWLERELEFWKKTGPTLQMSWWNGKGFESIDAVVPLRNRFIALNHAVLALGTIKYVEAEPVVRELNNLWRSLPHFYPDQVSSACEEVLRGFGTYRKGDKLPLPKYEVTFKGNKVFSSTVLREKFAEYVKAWDDLDDLEGIRDSDMFGYAQTRLTKFVYSQGYLHSQFSSERYSTERGEVVSITIEEGKQYRLGKVTIEGAKLFSVEQIRARLALREGELADGAALVDWLSKDVGDAYRDAGYFDYDYERDFDVNATSRQDNLEVTDVKVKIDEGPQFKVGSIKFDGKTAIDTTRLIAAMSLREGDIFTRKQLDDSIDELNKLGLSLDKKDVTISPDHTKSLVKIVLLLNKDRRPEKSIRRF